MIRARLTDGTFLLGIDEENVRRLMDNQPIAVNLVQLGGSDRVIIMLGKTQADILRTLKQANDGPLPAAQPLPEGH